MTNKEKYVSAFCESLEINSDETIDLQNVTGWDSIRQMALIATIEDYFSIEITPEDIVCLNSFDKGIKILRKYGVEI